MNNSAKCLSVACGTWGPGALRWEWKSSMTKRIGTVDVTDLTNGRRDKMERGNKTDFDSWARADSVAQDKT